MQIELRFVQYLSSIGDADRVQIRNVDRVGQILLECKVALAALGLVIRNLNEQGEIPYLTCPFEIRSPVW
jgi:hypothetical protein